MGSDPNADVTALSEKSTSGTVRCGSLKGTSRQCFDRLDHEILLSILNENIHDEMFIRLISELLEAGYMEKWKVHATLSGTPQGGVLSPLLANIYLDKLDKYVEQELRTRIQ